VYINKDINTTYYSYPSLGSVMAVIVW